MNDELLMKFLLKESTEEENEMVGEWLNTTDANKKHFTQLETIWKVSKTLNSESNVNEEQAWITFKAKTEALKTQPAIVKPLKASFGWLKIAAVLLVAVGAWVVYSVYGPDGYTQLDAGNQVRTETLPDGSALTLNKNASISYADNFKNNRSLKMESGDVFFEVAKDKTHPFVIHVDQVRVEVVGTSFNIRHLKKETEVNVETGIVKVRLGNDEIKLFKGEKVLINGNTLKLVKEQTTDQLYNYYKTKLFQADNIPLSKLVNTLNEAYGSNITLDEEAKNLRITTVLKMATLDVNLYIICQTLDLNLSRNGNTILLSHKK